MVVACRVCGRETAVLVGGEDFKDYVAGTEPGKAFPYLDDEDRGLLLSMTCYACKDRPTS